MEQKNRREEKYDWMVSYQWMGVPDNQRIKNLEKIVNFFEAKKLKIFCSDQFQDFFDLESMGSEENYNFCLEAQHRAKNILFFINAENESTGMKKELAFSLRRKQKKTLLLKNEFKDLDWVQEFRKETERIYFFDDFDDFELGKIFS